MPNARANNRAAPPPGSLWALSVLLAWVGCAATGTPQPATATQAPEGAPTAPTAPLDLRRLPPDALYGDLVRQIAQLDGLAEEAGREGCLLARYTQSGEFELRGELAVAVRPPPEPPDDLDALLQEGTSLRVISRYGSTGDGALAVVELTASRPTHAVAVLVLTDVGSYLVDLTRGAAGRTGPVPFERLAPALSALAARPEPTRLQLLAEASLPLATVDDALVALQPLDVAVSLATTLPVGTELPESLAAWAEPTCPDGLPELPSDAQVGDLDLAAVRAHVAPFSESARVCAHQVGGRALAGGKLVLALRVRPDGHVGQVCSVSDEIGEPRLLQCLTHAAARLRFAEPGGSVDLHLPLRLASTPMRVPRPACE